MDMADPPLWLEPLTRRYGVSGLPDIIPTSQGLVAAVLGRGAPEKAANKPTDIGYRDIGQARKQLGMSWVFGAGSDFKSPNGTMLSSTQPVRV